MKHLNRLLLLLIWMGAVGWLALSESGAQTRPANNPPAPKLWDARQLATWALPIAGVNATPTFYTEEEYYAAPVDNLRTYPVYHPDREPKGYRQWLKRQGARRLIEPETLRTEADWIAAGRRVFDELDVPIVRTSDPRALAYLRDREAIRKDGLKLTKDGIIPGLRWVVDKSGDVKLTLSECASCHNRLMADGSLIRGAQGNPNFGSQVMGFIFAGFARELEKDGVTLQQSEYANYGVPWVKDDIHERLKTMSEDEINRVDGVPLPGTFARFNGSPYYITKIPDLIGVKDRRYLDHTGTHLNRGPEDIARYGILVSVADNGDIGPHHFLTDKQRRILVRFSDEAMRALGKFIYALEPPPNPNKFDATAAAGQQVFQREGCALCHTPPLYTNNMLIPVDGFPAPKTDPATDRLHILRGVRIGTDPSLALKTRKGTGYYKVPSLRGLWYRGLIEHSGSIAALEDWFDPGRLDDAYIPSGWKGPGVTHRAVKGHEFGLDLSAGDKRALIAFLKTL